MYKFGSMKLKQSNIVPIKKSDLKLLSQPDERGMSEDLPQSEIKKYVPEQLQRQIFNIKLNEGTYKLAYDDLGQHVAVGSTTGHLAIFRLRDFQLLAEKKLTESVHDLVFLNGSLLAVSVAARVVIFDSTLLSVHNIFTGTCIGLEYLSRHMLLVSSTSNSLKYTDVTNGKSVADVPLQSSANKIRQTYQALIAVSSPNSQIIKFYSPNHQEPLYALNTGIITTDFHFTNNYLIVSGQRYIKIFDVNNWSGEVRSAHFSEEIFKFELSQTNMLAIHSKSGISFIHLSKIMTSNNVTTDNENVQHVNLSELIHQTHKTDSVAQMKFRNYFDNFAISGLNFEQLLVPGSGKMEIDSYKANVFSSQRQRNEKEVKDQLHKLPFELIGEDFLMKREKLTKEEQVYKRYQSVFDYMDGKQETDQAKSMKAKEHRRIEKMVVRKEMKQLAEKLEKKEESTNYLDKFKKLGKK
ncbi:BING4CGT_(NU131) domain-containing protein [Hexamita inflata]|uniref:BING4CGT (NU131) domain-containing protein n=1 Tax=Hexamita inflata TaxID=28002 RepID=A0AA86U8P8_9EUKA|nr:BING4CGT (NU131) domain-containing protein [Hexamita inflata]